MRPRGCPLRIDSVHEQITEVPDPRLIAAKDQAIAVYGPDHGHQAHHEDALHHDAQHVLLADQAAIEKGQPGRGHHQDQGR